MQPYFLQRRTVYFIAHSISPAPNTGGGSIILYRHLKRLKDEGYRIILISTIPSVSNEHSTEFEEIQIKKQIWHPPLRPKTPLLTKLRIYFNFLEVKRLIHPQKDDIVLSMFGDYVNLLALKISKYFNLPLFMIYHDDTLFNRYSKENLLDKAGTDKIIKHTAHFFSVSQTMKQLLENNGASSVSVLYPIPQGYNNKLKRWEDVNPENLSFCNSGALFYEFHYQLLTSIATAAQQINAQVTLIGNFNNPFLQKLNQVSSIKVTSRLKTTDALFKELIEHADVLLVFYSFSPEKEPRLYHSFPSKLIEYCHLGIPILIIAPHCSAVGIWAKETKWLSYLPSDNVNDIYNAMARFKNEDYWKSCQAQALEIAGNEFNPNKIHNHFYTKLLGNNEY